MPQGGTNEPCHAVCALDVESVDTERQQAAGPPPDGGDPAESDLKDDSQKSPRGDVCGYLRRGACQHSFHRPDGRRYERWQRGRFFQRYRWDEPTEWLGNLGQRQPERKPHAEDDAALPPHQWRWRQHHPDPYLPLPLGHERQRHERFRLRDKPFWYERDRHEQQQQPDWKRREHPER
jgi:hypothetical protein